MENKKLKLLKIKIPFIEYCEKELNHIPEEQWGDRKNNNKIKNFLSKILDGKEVLIFRNSNGHSYPVGMKLKMDKSAVANRSAISTSIKRNGEIRIDVFTFTGITEGGNTLDTIDLIFEEDLSTEDYLKTLTTVREVISNEIDVLTLSLEDSSMDVNKLTLKAITSLVNEPFGSINLLTLRRIIEENTTNTEVLTYRRELVERYR